MMPAKYIIIDRIFPVIFNSGIEHVTEAAGRTVTSAGMCCVYIDANAELQVHCWGKSISLEGIESNPDIDVKLIKSTLVQD